MLIFARWTHPLVAKVTAGLAVMALALGISVATMDDADAAPTVTGCFNLKTGGLRLLVAKQRCTTDEILVAWTLIPGPKGDPGAAGAKGETGAKDEAGATGPQGETGPTGAAGETGAQGDTGETGEKGDRGDRGETGAKGDTGETGARGVRGAKGDTGAAGASPWTTISAWDENTTYRVGPPSNVVSYRGGSYVALADNTRTTPGTDAASWAQIAKPGEQGPQGIPGAQVPKDCRASREPKEARATRVTPEPRATRVTPAARVTPGPRATRAIPAPRARPARPPRRTRRSHRRCAAERRRPLS